MVKERPMYRIAWRARLTGAEGHGTGRFTWQQAREIADALNAEKCDVPIDHWAEHIDAKNEQEDTRD